jgi:hypothetical protein
MTLENLLPPVLSLQVLGKAMTVRLCDCQGGLGPCLPNVVCVVAHVQGSFPTSLTLHALLQAPHCALQIVGVRFVRRSRPRISQRKLGRAVRVRERVAFTKRRRLKVFEVVQILVT